jgi:hypothetical protein
VYWYVAFFYNFATFYSQKTFFTEKKSLYSPDHGVSLYFSFLLFLFFSSFGAGGSEDRLLEDEFSELLKWLLTCFSSNDCGKKGETEKGGSDEEFVWLGKGAFSAINFILQRTFG